MNFKRALTVYRKEMLEMFRDKRTIFSTILLPFIMYPLIFIGFSSLMSRQTAKMEQKGATIAIVDSVDKVTSDIFRKELKGVKNFSYQAFSANTEKLIKEKAIHAVISIRDSIPASGLPVYIVTIRADKSTDKGKMIFEKLNKAMSGFERAVLVKRLSDRKIDSQFIDPIRVTEKDTATSQKKMGSILGMVLPYLLITLLIGGAAVVSSELIAGEKERRTLETLLVSSAHRNEIVMGKYLTTITFAMINVVVNLCSLYFSMKAMVSQYGMQMQGVKFPLDGFLLLLIALIPLATLYAAVLLSISSFSRNMKEARTYEQPILLVSMLLAMISWFPGFELNAGLALIPVINISLLFKAIMMGDYQISHFLLAVGSTLILDVIAIIVTVRLFNSESVLFRSEEDPTLKQLRKSKTLFFSPYYGMVYYLLALAALYYIGSAMQAKDMVSGLIQTQVLIIVLPVLLILRIIKQEPRPLLRLNKTNPLNFFLVPFIAVSAAIIVSLIAQLINMIYPFPKEYLEKMSELMKLPNLKLWQMYMLIAVLPGVCEELMFRGFLIRFFEKQGMWISILVSALLFAVFHLDPYRFLPVLFLGILLGWLAVKSNSLYVSMFSHALNNAVALSFVHFSAFPWLKGLLKGEDELQWWLVVPAVFVLGAALYAFNKINPQTTVAEPYPGVPTEPLKTDSEA